MCEFLHRSLDICDGEDCGQGELGCGAVTLSIHFPSFYCLPHQPPNGSRQLSCNQDGSLADIEQEDKKFASCHHLTMFCVVSDASD